jgi:hypothetical protein
MEQYQWQSRYLATFDNKTLHCFELVISHRWLLNSKVTRELVREGLLPTVAYKRLHRCL